MHIIRNKGKLLFTTWGESSTSLVLDGGGTQLDHIALCVPDTERGVEEIAAQIGFHPILTDPEPGQLCWSGAVPLGSGKFLEILGPNPAFKNFNPFIEVVKRLPRPTPLFWYVATNAFAAFQTAAKAARAPMERVEAIKHEKQGVVTDYTRGYLGPGFLSVSPKVIEGVRASKSWTTSKDRSLSASSSAIRRPPG